MAHPSFKKLDAKNFNKISEISVQNHGKPVEYINELEYANGFFIRQYLAEQ